MKNLFFLCFFLSLYFLSAGQIPSAGNILWLRADQGVYKDDLITPAMAGELVNVWKDFSGNGNHFRQDNTSQRPELYEISNVLCSQQLLKFDVGRRTYLQSILKTSGPKTVFIVFLSTGIVGNAQTLLSVKSNANTHTEILCTDNPAYRSISFISEGPSSFNGGVLANAVGANVSFSPVGNIFSMTYNGGNISMPSSYSSRFDASPTGTLSSGLFGRLLNDTTSIGARVPEQNFGFFSGYIGEIILYNRVLPIAEITQVENYLLAKFGFFGSCIVLPVNALDLNVSNKNVNVQLDWSMADESGVKEFVIDHSTNSQWWDSIGDRIKPMIIATQQQYRFTDTHPIQGINYYRLRIKYSDGKTKYSEIKMIRISGHAETFRVTPNPCRDYIYIQEGRNELLDIIILDAKGQLIKRTTGFSNRHLSIGPLPPGIYFVKIKGSQAESTQKLVKL